MSAPDSKMVEVVFVGDPHAMDGVVCKACGSKLPRCLLGADEDQGAVDPWLVSFAEPLDQLPGWVAVAHFARPRDRVECTEVTFTYVDTAALAEAKEWVWEGAFPDQPRTLSDDLTDWLQYRQHQCPPPTYAPVGGVTADLIRLLRIGDFQTRARARMASKEPGSLGWSLPEGWTDSKARPRRDSYYAGLAERYSQHLVANPQTDPAVPLAKEEHINIGTMRNRLSYSRKRGFLTSAGRGHFGGELTPLGRQVLEQGRP